MRPFSSVSDAGQVVTVVHQDPVLRVGRSLFCIHIPAVNYHPATLRAGYLRRSPASCCSHGLLLHETPSSIVISCSRECEVWAALLLFTRPAATRRFPLNSTTGSGISSHLLLPKSLIAFCAWPAAAAGSDSSDSRDSESLGQYAYTARSRAFSSSAPFASL